MDPVTGHWTLISEGRRHRPHSVHDHVGHVASCVFCHGSERQTCATVADLSLDLTRFSSAQTSAATGSYDLNAVINDALRNANADNFILRASCSQDDYSQQLHRLWFVRCVENKFPAFLKDDASTCATWLPQDASATWFKRVDAYGRHEVIVDSPRHIRGWEDFSDLEIELAFRMFRSRLQSLRAEGRYEHAFIFKNVGVNAGASQAHSHCQLTANLATPPSVSHEMTRLAQYQADGNNSQSRNFWREYLHAERQCGTRVIYADAQFLLWCPFASGNPMQVELCQCFDGDFVDYDDATLRNFARLARDAVRALQSLYRRQGSDKPLDYNVILNHPPFVFKDSCAGACGFARTRLTILPSVVKKAGYELGAQIDINPLSPERVAYELRRVWDDARMTF